MSKQWLAGLLDGEGYVGISLVKRKETNSLRFIPRIMLCMASDERWEKEVCFILNKLEVSFTVSRQKPKWKTVKLERTVITIKSRDALKKLIDAVYPYSILKTKQYDIMREFLPLKIDWREDISKPIDLIEKIRKLNFNRGTIVWTKEKILEYKNNCRRS